jgi:hypothetical protein
LASSPPAYAVRASEEGGIGDSPNPGRDLTCACKDAPHAPDGGHRSNERWNTGDRARVAAALNAIPNGMCVLPRAGNRIGVWINDHLALIIYPGYLGWPVEQGPAAGPFPDIQGDEHSEWHGLAAFQDRGLGHHGPVDPPEAICPTHHIALPINGICDECQ